MDRKELLSAIGVSAAAFTVMNCLVCSKGSNPGSSNSVSGSAAVDFTLDLTASANVGNKQFYCNNYGSVFTRAGTVKNSPASHNLTMYILH